MRHWLGYLVLRLATGLLAALPEPAMRTLGRWGGLVWSFLAPGRRAMAHRHMLRVGAPDPRAATRQLFAWYGRYWAETFWVRRRRFAAMWAGFECVGLEHLRSARDAGDGVVLALPHLGNWEAAALIAVHLDLPLIAVAERLPNPHVTAWFTRQRSMFGIDVVLTGSGPSSRRRIAESLSEGKAVALLCDRDLTGRGVAVEFWGEETTLPAGPIALAHRAGSPVIPVGVYFQEGRGHRAVLHPPLEFDRTGPTAEVVARGTQSLARVFEVIIAEDPSQWHLVQPNWPSDREALL
ncbi:phosphatidylinositol mannoside acyltransferase [soil metagenome]